MTAGLFSLDSEHSAEMEAVDSAVVKWAAGIGARGERHPELLSVADLRHVDYFDSFPHLAHSVSPWLRDSAADDEEFVLTSAACYGVYFSRAHSAVQDVELVTIRQTCRRREPSYEPLRRQREFQMREVVAIGPPRGVEHFLAQGEAFVLRLAEAMGIAGAMAVATDPFFRRDDPRLLHQRLFPTKQEFVDTSGLAIASVNSHRNFFGERCAISAADGTPAHTGCVAFGLERWVDALNRVTAGKPRLEVQRNDCSPDERGGVIRGDHGITS